MTAKTRLRKLVEKLNDIDSVLKVYNPTLVNIVGDEIWGDIALTEDTDCILHQDCDYIEFKIKEYEARADKSIKEAQARERSMQHDTI